MQPTAPEEVVQFIPKFKGAAEMENLKSRMAARTPRPVWQPQDLSINTSEEELDDPVASEVSPEEDYVAST